VYGNVIALGSPRVNDTFILPYLPIYTTSDGGQTWSSTQKLIPKDYTEVTIFGRSTAMYADVLAVGALQGNIHFYNNISTYMLIYILMYLYTDVLMYIYNHITIYIYIHCRCLYLQDH
jgi:hypothetical protein